MPKNKEQKKVILNDIKEKLEKSKSIVFTNFEALTMSESEELRNKLREEKSEFLVTKKTLLGLAMKDAKAGDLNVKDLTGKVAVVFGYGDEVAPAKVVSDFQKTHEGKIGFLAGILENRLINAGEVQALSQIPSRVELYAKLVGSINAPVSGFVNALAGNLRNLVYVLKAIEEKKV